MTYSPDQLQNAIESGLASGDADLSVLVRLARRLFYLRPTDPSREASQRMATRFEAVMAGEKPNRWAVWLPFGTTDARRPSFVQKFAAGALALSAVGGATSAATGVTPAEAVRTTIRVVASATANLAPHTIVQELTSPDQDAAAGTATNGETGNDEAPTYTPEPSTTPIAGVATTPGGNAETETPGATTTPIPSGTATPGTSGNRPPQPTPTPTSPATAAPAFPPSAPANTTTPPPTFAPAGTQTPAATPTPSPSSSSTPTSTPTQTPTATPTPHDEDEKEDEDGPEPTETPEPPEHEEDDR